MTIWILAKFDQQFNGKSKEPLPIIAIAVSFIVIAATIILQTNTHTHTPSKTVPHQQSRRGEVIFNFIHSKR